MRRCRREVKIKVKKARKKLKLVAAMSSDEK